MLAGNLRRHLITLAKVPCLDQITGQTKMPCQDLGQLFWHICQSLNGHLPNSMSLPFSSHAVVQLGKTLFPLFALALNLPEHFFDDKVRI